MEGGPPAPGEPNKNVLDVALAEFKALRDEISSRAAASLTLININAVASGVAGGLVVNNPDRVSLLLILPILSPVLGLLWLDHSNQIRNIGDYINSTLRPQIATAAAAPPGSVLAWEEYVDHYEKRKFLRFVPLGIPVLVLFAGVPVASLARTAGHLGSSWQWLLWIVGVALTACFIFLWARLIGQPMIEARRA